jgi:vacuolar-type H+-ATPase subunit I/STV1
MTDEIKSKSKKDFWIGCVVLIMAVIVPVLVVLYIGGWIGGGARMIFIPQSITEIETMVQDLQELGERDLQEVLENEELESEVKELRELGEREARELLEQGLRFLRERDAERERR